VVKFALLTAENDVTVVGYFAGALINAHGLLI
jgi:hypothetical protein